MKPRSGGAGLPATLLLLIAAQIDAAQAGGAFGPGVPTAVRKMSADAGEKFFPEYYAFGDDGAGARSATFYGPEDDLITARGLYTDDEERLLATNASAALPYRPPFAPHSAGGETAAPRWELFRRAAEAVAGLERRQYACPGGTTSCSNIGYPNSCCAEGETCFVIQDTGLGKVGCCPNGENCSGDISSCPSDDLACPSDLGGGCCIPGYVCQGVGCVKSATQVVTYTTTSTSVVSEPEPTTIVVTVVVTETPSQSAVTSTKTVTTEASSTSSGPGAPIRPTLTSTASGSSTTSAATMATTTTTTTTTTTEGSCPTGFYACSASAGGGCCQTGRNCETTSCPPVSSTTIISDGVTVVVPVANVPQTTETSTCATGWFLCPASAGPIAGCCPSGYGCGTASCTLATGTAAATVQKELPSAARPRSDAINALMLMTIPALTALFGGLW